MGVSHQLVLFDFPDDYFADKGRPLQQTREYGKCEYSIDIFFFGYCTIIIKHFTGPDFTIIISAVTIQTYILYKCFYESIFTTANIAGSLLNKLHYTILYLYAMTCTYTVLFLRFCLILIFLYLCYLCSQDCKDLKYIPNNIILYFNTSIIYKCLLFQTYVNAAGVNSDNFNWGAQKKNWSCLSILDYKIYVLVNDRKHP